MSSFVLVTTMDSPHLYEALPSELLVDILSLVPFEGVVHFASVSKAHLNLFNQENGLWQLLTCKIQHWSINGA